MNESGIVRIAFVVTVTVEVGIVVWAAAVGADMPGPIQQARAAERTIAVGRNDWCREGLHD